MFYLFMENCKPSKFGIIHVQALPLGWRHVSAKAFHFTRQPNALTLSKLTIKKQSKLLMTFFSEGKIKIGTNLCDASSVDVAWRERWGEIVWSQREGEIMFCWMKLYLNVVNVTSDCIFQYPSYMHCDTLVVYLYLIIYLVISHMHIYKILYIIYDIFGDT